MTKNTTIILTTIIIISGIVAIILLKPAKTPEELKARADIKHAQILLDIEREKAENQAILERREAQARIDANKPTEVRVQELKNEEVSTGEAIMGTAAIAGGAYLFSKMLSY